MRTLILVGAVVSAFVAAALAVIVDPIPIEAVLALIGVGIGLDAAADLVP